MCRNGEGWSQEALKTAKAWADVNVGQIGLQTKKVPCDSPTLSGDLRTPCPVEPFQWKTYSSYLVATGVARRRHDDDTQSKPEPRVNQRKETVSQHDKKNGRRKYKNKRSNDLNKRSDNPFVKNNSCADDSGIDHWWRTDSQSGSQDDSRSVSSDIRSDHRGQYRGGRRFERDSFSCRGRPSGGNQTWKGSNTNGHSFQEDRSFGKNFNGSGRGGYHETGRRTPVTPSSSVAFQGRGRDLGNSFKSDEVVFQTKVANIPRPAILHPVVQLESKEETSKRPADSKDDTEQKTERQRVNPSVSEVSFENHSVFFSSVEMNLKSTIFLMAVGLLEMFCFNVVRKQLLLPTVSRNRPVQKTVGWKTKVTQICLKKDVSFMSGPRN